MRRDLFYTDREDEELVARQPKPIRRFDDKVFFHEDHYRKVREARKKAGLPEFKDLFPENGRIFGHELEGRKLYNKFKRKEYTIQSVHKHWYHGWYYMILAYSLSPTESELLTNEIIDGKRYGYSHVPLMWENISCIDEIVLESIAENQLTFTLL